VAGMSWLMLTPGPATRQLDPQGEGLAGGGKSQSSTSPPQPVECDSWAKYTKWQSEDPELDLPPETEWSTDLPPVDWRTIELDPFQRRIRDEILDGST